MSQHDMVIDNTPGATFRTDINAAIAALVTNSSGTIEPTTKYPNMWWFDTGTATLKLRDPANTAWVGPTFSGMVTAQGGLISGATLGTAADPNAGLIISSLGFMYSKRTGTGLQAHIVFYNNAAVTPANVGQVETTGTTTNYKTTSDERLKNFTGELTGEDAIDVIFADPVRRWIWNTSGMPGVGWGAQTSYEVSPDLASPPIPQLDENGDPLPTGEPGDPGFQPWGMDYAKRTPYLWAALAEALKRIDALTARVAELEAARS